MTTTLHAQTIHCGRCGRPLACEPDGSCFCVNCATPRWWHNVSSIFGGAGDWGRGAMWILGGILVAVGLFLGMYLITLGLIEVGDIFIDNIYWPTGALFAPALALEIGYAWGVAAVLRRLLGERRGRWLAPLWVGLVSAPPIVVALCVL